MKRIVSSALLLVVNSGLLIVGCTRQPVVNDEAAITKVQQGARADTEGLRLELDKRAEKLVGQLRGEHTMLLADAEKRIRAEINQQIIDIEGKAIEAEAKAVEAENHLRRAQESLESTRTKLAEGVVPKAPAVVEQPEADHSEDAEKPGPVRKKPNPATARLAQLFKKAGGTSELDAEGSIIRLDLSGTQINDATLAQIEKVASLTGLDLEGTSINDMGVLRLIGLKNLAELRLAGTSVTEAAANILAQANPRLRILWAASPRLQTQLVETFKKFGGEVELEASASGVPQIVSVVFPYQLNLDIAQRRFPPVTDELFPHLRGLTKLTRFEVYSENVTNQGIAFLASAGNLESLRIEWAALDDKGLAHLSKLTKLRLLGLHGTQITDTGLPHLAGFTDLEVLYVGETQVSGTGFRQLRALQKLQRIDLGSETSDAGLAELVAFKSLREVYLGGRKNLTEAGMANLQRALPKLKIHN